MGTVVRLEDYCKSFKSAEVLKNINLTLESGKVIGLKGKNGSGKTMLMRAISGLILPTSGKVFINDRELGKQISFPPSIGLLIENPSFISNYTGFKNLKILASIQNRINDEEIKEAIRKVGLDPDDTRTFKKYSLGMKQRLGIAAAIMHSPELLILDEPINGLDPVGIKEIRALLKTLAHDYGTTILISSHILSEIEHIADVIGVMDHGNLIEELSKEELENRLNKHADFKVSDIQLASEILKQSGFRENIDFIVKKTPENNTSIRLFNHLDLRDEINEKFVKSGIKVSELMLCEENLEEFFTRLIGNDVRFS